MRLKILNPRVVLNKKLRTLAAGVSNAKILRFDTPNTKKQCSWDVPNAKYFSFFRIIATVQFH